MTRDIFGPERAPRSVSQINQYNRCPYSYYLARIEMVWQKPAAWLPQGTAVHYGAEWWERTGRTGSLEDMIRVALESYDDEVRDYLAITPNVDFWQASGQYRGARDIARRRLKVVEQATAYYQYYMTDGIRDVIWIAPDGQPGIELGFDFDLDGVRVRGFIDALIERRLDIPRQGVTHELIVRDNKTGNNPGDDFQLAVYGVAVQDRYGVEPERGDYWMGRSGKPTAPYDLTRWPRSRVADRFAELEERIDAGDFPPDPEPDKCQFCDVSASCEFRA